MTAIDAFKVAEKYNDEMQKLPTTLEEILAAIKSASEAGVYELIAGHRTTPETYDKLEELGYNVDGQVIDWMLEVEATE